MKSLTRRQVLATGGMITLPGCSMLSSKETPRAPLDTSDTKKWPMYRGDVAQTGRANTELEPPYEVDRLWGFGEALTIPDHRSLDYVSRPGIAVTDRAVYATAVDTDYEPTAVHRTDPQRLWGLADIFDGDPHPSAFARTPAPVVAGEDVFVHSKFRRDRIDAESEELVWNDETGLSYGDRLTGNREELYLSGSVARIDPETGNSISTERSQENAAGGGVAVGTDVAVHALRIDSGRSGLVVGFDTDDWSVQWEEQFTEPIFEAPAIHDGQVFVLTDGGRQAPDPVSEPGAVVALNGDDGSENWRADLSGARIGVGVDSDTVYAPHVDDGLVALDATDGSRQWSLDEPLRDLIGDPAWAYPPVVADDAVVIGGPKGLLIADAADGSIRWQRDLRLRGAPAVAFGDIYAITDDRIVAVRSHNSA